MSTSNILSDWMTTICVKFIQHMTMSNKVMIEKKKILKLIKECLINFLN